jgi:anthranilate/para-aminobenzoate synthase component I
LPSPSTVASERIAPAERRLDLPGEFRDVVGALRRPGTPNLLLEGAAMPCGEEGWSVGPLLAIAPRARVLAKHPEGAAHAFAVLAAAIERRRGSGPHHGSPRTGIAVIASYEAGRSAVLGTSAPALAEPAVVAWTVDRSVCWDPAGDALMTVTGAGRSDSDALAASLLRRAERRVDPPEPARAVGLATTSLPKERYLRSVERILGHIRRGDIYQANLCQRFALPVAGDAFAWHREQVSRFPAPRSAWAELPGVALASASPETFLRVTPDGTIATWPIKGTRPRALDRGADGRIAAELQASEKDRAELLMIVDLERNDLGRVCRVGSIRVPELAALRSFATVHHLIARVVGNLDPSVGVSALLDATFPGGSITGAPKRRAMELLAEVEPVPRGWFTGSLIWFGDDGSVDSSILIRSPVFCGGQVFIGAGGGIVADSEPLAEWRESNHKAGAAADLLGFDPEQAM